MSVKECDVRDRAGNWYSLRIRPYKNVENRIGGAVLALLSIDAQAVGNRDRWGTSIPAEVDGARDGDGNGDGQDGK